MGQLEAIGLDYEASLEELWTWPEQRLQKALPWPAHLFKALELYRSKWGASPQIDLPEEALLPMDLLWPGGFLALKRPPLALFWQGRQELLSCLGARKAVAIVGTRRASNHGLRMAKALGSALAQAGWPVVSGLAEGIDAAAHRGCLEACGAPVAVLGTPLQRVYPQQHDELQACVATDGLLITEQPKHASVTRGSFVARNRLLAAFVKAVVVVECPEGSGALITARRAVEQHCSLLVVPGDARRWSALGSNALLLDQASPLLSPEALIDQLGVGPLEIPSPMVACDLSDSRSSSRTGQHGDTALLQAIGDGAFLEDLITCLDVSSTRLIEQLLQLELQGVLVAEPGLRWRLA
ncbi:MAG TPA: DNA-processing protein DprA [Prochlorococcaceae cyanobacterium Gl_MAG_24]|nr:DNA-processing protein DprA [Prochlorococcaceae cyanobacterium ETNP14_MAG_4]HJL68783.1 DNA-processing protein DprA [Prochlorococcaceae cyanobacterium Gl_MAG_24]